MRVRVSDVKKWAGREERLLLSEPWPEILNDRLDAEIQQPASVAVLVRNINSGLLVEVSGQAHLRIQCARCLDDAEITIDFTDSQEFRDEPGPPEVDVDYERFSGDHINLDVLVADAVALEVPLAALCSNDCRGLCPQCGVNRNVSSCDCAVEEDPRWQRLRQWSRSETEPMIDPKEDENGSS